jgi:hypothetical protein
MLVSGKVKVQSNYLILGSTMGLFEDIAGYLHRKKAYQSHCSHEPNEDTEKQG